MTEKWTAGDVLARLREKRFAAPAHVMLEEVRNRTGYGGTARYADALVASVWPSRGRWLAGVEVKVSRSDWRHELAQPAKAEAIAKFCDYWWVAAPRGVVPHEELPANWGLIEVHGKAGCGVIKDAPRQTPAPMTTAFVLSIMRNAAKSAQPAVDRALAQQRADFQAQLSEAMTVEQRVRDAEAETARHKRAAAYAQRDVDKMRELVTAYAQATGIEPEELRPGRLLPEPSVAATYRLARHLQRTGINELDWLAKFAAEAAAEARSLLDQAEKDSE